MATNAESRPDLRTTIPLAAKTVIGMVGKPRRSWVIPLLTVLTGLVLAAFLLELMIYPLPASALAYDGELRSQLVANYGSDPITSSIHELRLSIAEEVFGGSGSSDQARGDLAAAPVPTVTPEPTDKPDPATPTEPPTATNVPPTDSMTAEPSETPSPTATSTPSKTPTETPVAGLDCSKLVIENMWFQSDDKIYARVQNDFSKDAYLSFTLLEWPDLPGSSYIDYFRFHGEKYYGGNDYSSPTSSGSWVRIRHGHDETWYVDFDHEPEDGIYGFFGLTLKFTVPAYGGNCTLTDSLSKPVPPGEAPITLPSSTPLPATPAPTNTSVPSTTPEPSDTPPATGTPESTAAPTHTNTPEPTATST